MAQRKPMLRPSPMRPELDLIYAELREQRISFAYGNAPKESGITKESVREASRTLLMLIK